MKTFKTIIIILLAAGVLFAVKFHHIIGNGTVKYKVYSNSYSRFETKLPEDVNMDSSDMIYNGRPLRMYNYNSVDNRISYEISHFTVPEDGSFDIDAFISEVNNSITDQREDSVNENQFAITTRECTGENAYDCRKVLIKLYTIDRDLAVSYKVLRVGDRCYIVKMTYDQDYSNVSEKEEEFFNSFRVI